MKQTISNQILLKRFFSSIKRASFYDYTNEIELRNANKEEEINERDEVNKDLYITFKT